jgi:peroxiredoxin
MRGARSSRRLAVLLALGVLAAGALAGCGGRTASVKSASSQSGYVPGTGVITTVPVGQRQAAPALAGKDLDGNAVSLAALRGKVVVLNVWASWCDPCNAEAPALEQVYQDNKAAGVAFLGIDTRDTVANGKAFQRVHGIGYPSVNDPDGMLLLSFRGQLSPQAIPSTLIIDRQGRIAVRALTGLTLTQLRQSLAPVVAER